MPTLALRRAFATAMIAGPLMYLGVEVVTEVILPADDYDTQPLLQAIHRHDQLWAVAGAVALLDGLVVLAGTIGLLILTYPRAPRWTVATALVLVPGAVGFCLHAVFWNILHGAMARTDDYAAMGDLIDQTEAYLPFRLALIIVIAGSVFGLMLSAVALWRSRTVAWWVGLLGMVFPVNELIGLDGWAEPLSVLPWTLTWTLAARALVGLTPPGSAAFIPVTQDTTSR